LRDNVAPYVVRRRRPAWLWRLPGLRRWATYIAKADNVRMHFEEIEPGLRQLVAVTTVPKLGKDGMPIGDTIYLRHPEEMGWLDGHGPAPKPARAAGGRR
jgi:hypothetical protein